MASIKLRIRKSRVNKKGESPIFIQIFSGKTKREISAGVSISSEFWDDTRAQIKRAHPRSGMLNRILRNRVSDIQQSMDRLQEQSSQFTASDIINYKKAQEEAAQPKNHEIISFLKDHIERNPDSRKESTLISYNVFVNCFNGFKPKLTFDKLDSTIVKEYHKYLAAKGLAVNTISNRMKALRKVISLANEKGILDSNPMSGYRRKNEEGKKEYLLLDEVKLLEEFEARTEAMQKVIDMFLFNVYTGIRISDLFTFTDEEFEQKNGNIYFNLKMNKTGKLINHKIADGAKAIFDKYYDANSNYVFNILDERKNLNDPKILLRDISAKTAYYNKVLKETGKLVGIDKKITTHVARHTFATVMLSLGARIEEVSEILGHKSIRETQIYAKITNEAKDKAIDLWNKP